MFIVTYSFETTSLLFKSLSNKIQFCVVELDLEKEKSETKDTKESEFKLYTYDNKGLNSLNFFKQELQNIYSFLHQRYISSDYSPDIFFPPEQP